jgi:hypothetical protein
MTCSVQLSIRGSVELDTNFSLEREGVASPLSTPLEYRFTGGGGGGGIVIQLLTLSGSDVLYFQPTYSKMDRLMRLE